MYRDINIKDFHYNLPDSKIAKYPLKERDRSLLLFFDGKDIDKKMFFDLPDLLDKEDFLVLNNTRVIHARLKMKRETLSEIEFFCLEPLEPNDYTRSFQATNSCRWKVMIGKLKRWKREPLKRHIQVGGNTTILEVRYCNSLENMAHEVEFLWDNPIITFAEILDVIGELPIPPYLNRKAETQDSITYQTTYAKTLGSVAAPTAGLHFTDKMFERLYQKGIKSAEITLNIGAGTFQPIKEDNISNHKMHSETFSIGVDSLEKMIANIASIVAVGTTSVRSLESLYYIGCHIKENPLSPSMTVLQWEAYNNTSSLSTKEALEEIYLYMKNNKLTSILAKTEIIIVPGFRFRVVKKMITNFHQPQSTLLLLVSAFVGDNSRKEIYRFALDNGFRFLSYGDSSLLVNNISYHCE